MEIMISCFSVGRSSCWSEGIEELMT